MSMSTSTSAAETAQSTAKLDYLRALEETEEVQAEPEAGRPKYFITFPYPYMNGKLHLGHLYSFSKADFTAYYRRLLGYNVLFPFAFHCTGMPISASASKLKEELSGKPVDVSVVRILKDFGFDNPIPFTDPAHWIRTFPKYAQATLRSFHSSIDWRRSFITTDVNPYYDSFVRFQFNSLRRLGLLAFGKRYCIFCPVDRQPCLDHDRRKGEGVKPAEVVLRKVRCGNGVLLVRTRQDPGRNMGGIEKVVLSRRRQFSRFGLNGTEYIVESDLFGNLKYQVDGLVADEQPAAASEIVGGEDCPIELIDKEIAGKVVYGLKPADSPAAAAAAAEYEQIVGVKNEQNVLVENGLFVKMYEPEGPVISRSGGQCVVSLQDQWFIDYGNEQWKQRVRRCLGRMELTEDTRAKVEEALDGIYKWGFSRSFGLGTRVPWEPEYLIDSLSDSTIYMVFYTVKHLLFGDLEGAEPRGIPAASLDDSFWSYILGGVMIGEFSRAECPEHLAQYRGVLDKCRESVNYFYPVDLRVSGKDLIGNHILFFLFNHVALFREEFWPRRIFTNGHILLNSAKMSKSEGNFLSADDALLRYGASATRMCLANCCDTNDDANFEEDTVNAFILRLFTLAKSVEDLPVMSAESIQHAISSVLQSDLSFRLAAVHPIPGTAAGCEQQAAADAIQQRSALHSDTSSFIDSLFLQAISRNIRLAVAAYESMAFRDVLKYGFFELTHSIELYLALSGASSELLCYAYRTILQLIYPIVPSLSRPLLSAAFSGQLELPRPATQADDKLAAFEFVKGLCNRIITGKKEHRKCIIAVSAEYPQWKREAMAVADSIVDRPDCDRLSRETKTEAIGRLNPLFKGHGIQPAHGLKFAMDYMKDRSKYTIVFNDGLVLSLLQGYVERVCAVEVTLATGDAGEPMKPTITFQ